MRGADANDVFPHVERALGRVTVAMMLMAVSSHADVTLVEDGRARSVICVPANVMETNAPGFASLKNPARELELQRQLLRESVRDLAWYLGKISGASIEVVTNAPPPADKRVPILIGDLAQKRFGSVGRTYPFKQAFRVVVSKRGVGLYGESHLATSYAIYELLDQLGCRWFMPSEMGEVIPETKTISLKTMDLKSAPGTIYRGVWYADGAYRRRNRHGGLLLNAGHALEMYVSPEQRKQHPEWRATLDGVPQPHRLKWSSVGVANAIADEILKRLDQNPDFSVSLSPDDGLGFDNSPEDRALDAGDMDTTFNEVSITDRLMALCNRIIGPVSQKHPDLLFGMLAYANYVRPPVREKVHPNLVPQLAPITYARAHPMSDDRVPGNLSLRYSVEGWAKRAKLTSFYFYGWFLAEPVAPNPMLTKWGHDVPYVLEKGNCKFWQPETQPNFETSMHALYLGCRLAFHPRLQPADVFREINDRFYGAAAKEMTAYWAHIDRVWVDLDDYSGCGFGYLRRWTPDQLQKARELMNAALAAARTPREKFRIGLADDSLRLFDAFMKLRRDQAEGRFAHLATEAAAWRKEIQRLGDKYADQYTFTRMGPGQILSEGYFAQFYEKTYQDASRIAAGCTLLTEKPLRTFKWVADPDKKGEATGFAKADFDDREWKTTDVCVETWSTLGYHDYFKSMWYRASVPVPAVPAGKKVYLWVGSTDGTARVFVNGQPISYVKVTETAGQPAKTETLPEADGYCQPFSFDITAAVNPGATNQIAILCTRTFFNELGTGGLLGPVALYRERD